MSLKDNIKAVAIDLFSRSGIKRVSMNDIARKANVSKRTLYDFFSDKESLLVEMLQEISEPFSRYMKSLEETSYTALEIILLLNEKMVEKPTWFCEEFFEDIKRYPNALRLMLDIKKQFIYKIVKLLKRGEKEAVFMSDINYDLISIIAHKEYIINETSDIYTRYTHEEIHNTIFYIFLRGISTNAGREIIDGFVTKKKYKSNNIQGIN
ncbi:MAG: TetR/AcrR family transcriptional regulator [Tannerella sp.]|jgi:AcrR family transcriptional regulator|nr:TetR/AcrR family transcriptional regulator [Tannerella sp.]